MTAPIVYPATNLYAGEPMHSGALAVASAYRRPEGSTITEQPAGQLWERIMESSEAADTSALFRTTSVRISPVSDAIRGALSDVQAARRVYSLSGHATTAIRPYMDGFAFEVFDLGILIPEQPEPAAPVAFRDTLIAPHECDFRIVQQFGGIRASIAECDCCGATRTVWRSDLTLGAEL